jgi:recombination protein RecA
VAVAAARAKRGKDKEAAPAYVFQSVATAHRGIRVLPTGIVGLDAMLGGGIPRGKMIEIYGPYKAGKTILMMEIARAFQSVAASESLWVDAEHAFDPAHFARLGGDNDRMYYDDEADTVEAVFATARAWAEKTEKAKGPRAVFLDSIARLGTVHEFETEMSKRSLDKAGLVYRGLRQVTGEFGRGDVTFVVVNQVRDKVGVFFGSPETTTSGRGPEYFASVRLRIAQGTLVKEKKVRVIQGGRSVGMHVVIRTEKNRLMPDSQQSEFKIMHMTGFDPIAGALRLLALNGIIKVKEPDEFSYEGRVIDDDEAFIDTHPDLLRGIWAPFRPEAI